MGKIYDSLIKFFYEDWFFTQNDEATFLRLLYDGKNGEWVSYAQAYEGRNQFVFYSVYPQSIPDHQRPSMAELLTRINYGLVLGNFEMDYEDGEVRFKTSIDIENSDLTADLIKPVVFANLGMMDRYWPALTAVFDDRAKPKEAIELIKRI